MNGVLLVDKPIGPTSHDVVAKLRRRLGTRQVGHAGTLDPQASGLLVVLCDEATKLQAILMGHAKRYRASVVLGVATDSFDAAGARTRVLEIPEWLRAELLGMTGSANNHELTPHRTPRIFEALCIERQRTEQRPPAHSAIHVNGRRSYELARRGEEPELAPRSIDVQALTCVGAACAQGDAQGELVLEMAVSKGYYVRALARDLGENLGVPAHLGALRRLSSGPFHVEDAIDPACDDATLRSSLRPMDQVVSQVVPVSVLTEQGVMKARRGQVLRATDFDSPNPTPDLSAWMDSVGALVALGRAGEDGWRVERGFRQ